jgi:DegV family protein with EDD domain
MAKIQIITDSTSSLPKKLLKEFNISTVPINIVWDGQVFADGIDLSREEFFERMRTAYQMPTTAAPTPGAFHEVFDRLGNNGESVLAILMAREFSSTIQTAEIAAKLQNDKNISMWDSHSISMGLGFQVLAAARAVARGSDMDEVIAMLRILRRRSGVFITVNDMSFLRRGGRLSRSQYLMANVIGYQPILEVNGGPMTSVDRARSDRAARARMMDLVEERTGGVRPLRLAIGYTDNKAEGEAFLQQAEQELKPDEILLFPVSQANSVHGGPGLLGISYSAGQ